MSFDAQKLLSLLPTVYRLRDLELAEQIEQALTPANLAALQSQTSQGGPLQALLSVIAEQAVVLEDNLDQLYDDFFIETCAAWVVPYIGDLVGARGISSFPGARFSERAFVGNTMTYRRRKGTVAVLEQLARDLTGWDASVVEYFQLLATTQFMNHIRRGNLSFPDLGDSKSLELINTPFDKVTRTVDVRRIEPRRGKYNIPNIGIFLWRLSSYSVTSAPAFKLDDQRFLFDALGKDIQLFIDPQTEAEITHLSEPANVPMPLGRRFLHRYLDDYYGLGKTLFVTVDGVDVPISHTSPSPSHLSVCICDLSDVKDNGGNVIGWAHNPAGKVAIDPQLGRIAFPIESPPNPPQSVRVTYHYGFSAPMGGGEYDREASFSNSTVDVSVPGTHQTSIQSALNQIVSTGGAVEITNSDVFFETPIIEITATGTTKVELRASDGARPVIAPATDITISGGEDTEITLNGLVIAGALRIPAKDSHGNDNKLGLLRLRHCTLVPGAIPLVQAIAGSPPPSAPAKAAGARLIVAATNVKVEIEQCIVGPIQAVAGATVSITDSIVDATAASKVAYSGLADSDPGAPLTVVGTTIIGQVYTRVMKLASNTIFFAELKPADTRPAPVQAERLQEGCVRFSFVPWGSQLPRLFNCQPATEADVARVRPGFTSLRYGDAAYCQLSLTCALEIKTGADDQGEMGAFHNLYQPRREANLRAALDEYLRFGLEAGIFYAS
jgi:hypothetical protein